MRNIHALFASISFSLFAAPSFGQKPLNCEMQMMLNGMTALQRDQGVPRSEAVIAKNADGELKPQEIKQILDRVYIHQRNRTPDQIKDEVYRKCQSSRR